MGNKNKKKRKKINRQIELYGNFWKRKKNQFFCCFWGIMNGNIMKEKEKRESTSMTNFECIFFVIILSFYCVLFYFFELKIFHLFCQWKCQWKDSFETMQIWSCGIHCFGLFQTFVIIGGGWIWFDWKKFIKMRSVIKDLVFF